MHYKFNENLMGYIELFRPGFMSLVYYHIISSLTISKAPSSANSCAATMLILMV
jgi:hypothetical protein